MLGRLSYASSHYCVAYKMHVSFSNTLNPMEWQLKGRVYYFNGRHLNHLMEIRPTETIFPMDRIFVFFFVVWASQLRNLKYSLPNFNYISWFYQIFECFSKSKRTRQHRIWFSVFYQIELICVNRIWLPNTSWHISIHQIYWFINK